MVAQLDSFTRNSVEFLHREEDLLLHGLGLPRLRTTLAGRPVVVVVRSPDHAAELAGIARFVREQGAVLVGVQRGADALLEAGLKPRRGRARRPRPTSVDAPSPKALKAARDVVLRVDRGHRPDLRGALRAARRTPAAPARPARRPRTSRCCWPTAATPRSSSGSACTRRSRSSSTAQRPGLASTYLTRLTVGERLVDARTLPAPLLRPGPPAPRPARAAGRPGGGARGRRRHPGRPAVGARRRCPCSATSSTISKDCSRDLLPLPRHLAGRRAAGARRRRRARRRPALRGRPRPTPRRPPPRTPDAAQRARAPSPTPSPARVPPACTATGSRTPPSRSCPSRRLDATRNALTEQVQAAGGQVSATYAVQPALVDTGEKTLVDTLGSQLMTQLARRERLGRRLDLRADRRAARRRRRHHGADRQQAARRPVGHHPVQPGGRRPARPRPASPTGRASYVVLLLGEESDAEADPIFTGLVSGLTAHAAGVVVAGDDPDGRLGRLRSDPVAARGRDGRRDGSAGRSGDRGPGAHRVAGLARWLVR